MATESSMPVENEVDAQIDVLAKDWITEQLNKEVVSSFYLLNNNNNNNKCLFDRNVSGMWDQVSYHSR